MRQLPVVWCLVLLAVTPVLSRPQASSPDSLKQDEALRIILQSVGWNEQIDGDPSAPLELSDIARSIFMDQPISRQDTSNLITALHQLERELMAVLTAENPAAARLAQIIINHPRVVMKVVLAQRAAHPFITSAVSAFTTFLLSPSRIVTSEMADGVVLDHQVHKQHTSALLSLLELDEAPPPPAKGPIVSQAFAVVFLLLGIIMYLAGCRETITNTQLEAVHSGSVMAKVLDLLCNMFFWGRWFRAILDYSCWDPDNLPPDCINPALRKKMDAVGIPKLRSHFNDIPNPQPQTQPASLELNAAELAFQQNMDAQMKGLKSKMAKKKASLS